MTTNDYFTKFPNDLLNHLIHFRVPGVERQVFDFILRKTHGFNKKKDEIALSQFQKATGLKKPNIINALKRLQKHGLISVIKKDNRTIKTYRINLQINTWKSFGRKSKVIKKNNESTTTLRINKQNSALKPSNKEDKSLSKRIITVIEPNNQSVRKVIKKDTHKKNIFKKITKENATGDVLKKTKTPSPLTKKQIEGRISLLQKQAKDLLQNETYQRK